MTSEKDFAALLFECLSFMHASFNFCLLALYETRSLKPMYLKHLLHFKNCCFNVQWLILVAPKIYGCLNDFNRKRNERSK